MAGLVEVEYEQNFAVLKLNRPEVLNAINNAMRNEMVSLLGELAEKDECRAVVITGNGRAFSVGADVKELAQLTPIQHRKKAKFGANEPYYSLSHFPKPTIAAINGYALGGGCEIALASDIRIASSDASIGLPEVSIGLIPGSGGTQRLPRLIGPGLAKELIFTGRRITATEAERIGVVNHVYPPEVLLKSARELAQAISENAPISLMLAKAAIDKGLDMDLPSGLLYEAEIGTTILGTEDRVEGTNASREKRKPKYIGK
ncbi:MAG: enoyl-CoA hydratase-related protein [Thaumarchaeota archaeon]|nr:enoyl-CoA hydratase-related protein [Nitrososphaerota archaeon]